MSISIRQPAVAGRFYPGDPQELRQTVQGFLPDVEAEKSFAVVAPHAGYVYSGKVAGVTLARCEMTPTVLVLCPKHTRLGRHSAVMSSGAWALPTHDMLIDEGLAAHLLEKIPEVEEDPAAHAHEHSLEVILPFLYELRQDIRFVPLALGYRSLEDCKEMGEALAVALQEWKEPILIVVSSDMNHQESLEITLKKDQLALDRIEAMDPEGLYEACLEYDITMCGVIPTTIALFATMRMGATKAKIVEHTTSADASGNTRNVVGYSGILIQ